ncbi:MAG TPA: DUF1178 family protein [Stellaceae bacterium]|nr:DUF1178 family protein [Stellaceae bacterium]
MIVFSLRCAAGHEFEAWFRDGESFEAQREGGEISCPQCGDDAVDKAVMAPRLTRSRAAGASEMSPARLRAALLALRRQVETHCDYVGERFAEEARRIHNGEAEAHGIYGEASEKESRELAEEGIEFGRIPWISPDS